MKVYCPQHGQVRGVVRLRGNPPRPCFESRSPRWRDHFADQIGLTGRDNLSTNLRDTTRSEVSAPGCRDCPDDQTVPVAALLEAFESGLPKIRL